MVSIMEINMSEDMYTRIDLIRIISEKKKYVLLYIIYISRGFQYHSWQIIWIVLQTVVSIVSRTYWQNIWYGM